MQLGRFSGRAATGMTAAALALLSGACTVDKQQEPSVSAPSGFAMTVTSSASPDTLPRDGVATANLRILVHDYQDKAVAGQRLTLSATTGTLSTTDVTTDSTGFATARFTAPPMNTPVSSALITVTPVGTDLGTVVSGRSTVTVALAGPSVPVVSFSWTPTTPGQFGLVSFDASTTTLDGKSCSTCTFSWDFGDGSTGSGTITSHSFSTVGSVPVKLTVTGPGGVVVTSTRTVVIGTAAPITAVITQSPTDAKINDTIFFDASLSTTPDGTAIVSWSWDFGNGLTGSTKQATTTYTLARTYTVRLTITDALGRTATTTKTVTVN